MASGTLQSLAARMRMGADGRDVIAPRLARAIGSTAFAGYGVVTILNVFRTHSTQLEKVLCAVGVLALYGLQFRCTSARARQWTVGRRRLVLGVQGLLTFVPLFWLGMNWGSMVGPFAGSVLLTLPGPLAWSAFGSIQFSMIGYAVSQGFAALEIGYIGVSGTLAGLVIYGLTRLSDLVREVHDTRAEMARMAVTQERLRFARDLHDLLGYGLSTITLKSELIHRLIDVNPERARSEVASVLSVSRQALADVRLVASGYRAMSLEREAGSVAEVMAVADVRADVNISCGRLHPVVDTVLATALREGVTNILRHSKVQTCTITGTVEGDRVRLVLTNDGVSDESRTADPHSGSGLGNLRTRLSEIGGGLTAGAVAGSSFRLVAEAPVVPVAARSGLKKESA
ncbi:histidine kinase [Streptomyces sp. NPDC050738]|uniref:sensor histidine kinase n=1 Tax=Streptomyces sp. NPDC050738 TaxID=3154744 RepID=UPI003420088E